MCSIEHPFPSNDTKAGGCAAEHTKSTERPHLPHLEAIMSSILDTEYLMGLGTRDGRMLILLDIDRLMSSEEMGLIANIAS